MTATPDRPLSDVLRQTPQDFDPEHPYRRPWMANVAVPYDLASTGNITSVPLDKTRDAQLTGLDTPSSDQDWLEPWDWARIGWTPA